MDRRIVYMDALAQDTDILLTNKNAMISDGWVAQGILGSSTLFYGLACTPTGPATLTVNVAPGAVFSQQNIDNSAYGSVNSDTTDQIVKVGINQVTQNFSCPAPVTSGKSVVYLVQAAFAESDTGATVLPYFNAANPDSPWAGPNNTGVSQNTMRQNLCNITLKTGVAATTGSQVTPAPDVGFTGLWAITVANGQSTVTSGNIAPVSGAPFITESLTQKISQTTADARYAQISQVQTDALDFALDTGTTNTLVAALSPAITTLTQGMSIVITVANNNNGASTLNLNSLGAKNITNKGNALIGGELAAGQNAALSYNGATWNLMSSAANLSQLYTGSASTTGSANAQVLASVTPSGFSLLFGNIVTFTAGFTNTGATTINVSGTGVITIKKKNSGGGLVDLAASDLVATDIYQIIYDGTFWELYSLSFPPSSTFFQVANNLSEGVPATMRSNLGLGSAALLNTSGVFQPSNNLSEVVSQSAAQVNLGIAPPIAGSRSKFASSWASNTTVSITCNEAILENGSGSVLRVSGVSQTSSIGAVFGSGGNLDTGTVAANTWYYTYLIYDPGTTTVSSLISASSTAPTLPSGYTYKARVGSFLTDGSGHIIGFTQVGSKVQYRVGSNLSGLPVMASGVAGSTSTPTWAAIAVAGFVPPTAGIISVCLFSGGANTTTMAAPNNSYGTSSSTSNPPPLMGIGGQVGNYLADFILESSSIYWASNTGSSAVACFGYIDNL